MQDCRNFADCATIAAWKLSFILSVNRSTVTVFGVHRKALILNANVFNHCIRYKIPSGPVNIVGSFKYLVHLYFQYMSAAKLHQSCRTCHIIFNVEYLKSVKNVGLCKVIEQKAV